MAEQVHGRDRQYVVRLNGQALKLEQGNDGLWRTRDGRVYAYRTLWHPEVQHPIQVEAECFSRHFTVERGGRDSGKDNHFWNLASFWWGPNSMFEFKRHPWAEEMAYEAARHSYVALTGCASSGKSEFMAAWGLAHWGTAPLDTMVLMSSTTIREARRRIWAATTRWFRSMVASGYNTDATLVETPTPMIRLPGQPETASISVIPGGKGEEQDAVGKLIGLKAWSVLLMADELSELSHAILEACFTNLSMNQGDEVGRFFQLFGAFNAKSRLDPGGLLAEPADGWNSITVDSTKWRTKRGVCLHFDGEQSPNLLEHNLILPSDPYPIYGRRHLEEHRKLGRNTPGYWRQCRGFWCPVGVETTIYTESEIISCGGMETEVEWQPGTCIKLSALDPAHTAEGDRSACITATAGLARLPGANLDGPGRFTILVDPPTEIRIDVTNRSEEANFQIVRKWRDMCKQMGITPYNAAFDATNIPFADIVSSNWSREVLRVPFGGAASDRRTSDETAKPASEVYYNRRAELWFGGVDFLRAGQLKGLTRELIAEMVEVKYDQDLKRGDNFLLRLEKKKEMKARCGFSPDFADALFVLIELAKQRFGLRLRAGIIGARGDWDAIVRRLDVVADSPAVAGYSWDA